MVKVLTGLEPRQVVKLLLRNTLFSANGRMNIDSKGTPNHCGNLELGQFFQFCWDRATGRDMQVHFAGQYQ